MTKIEYQTPEVEIIRLNLTAPLLTSGGVQQLDNTDWEDDWA